MTATISAPSASREQSRRSASEWRALIRAFSRGDATRKQFCARHGVALSTFDWWRSRLRRELSQTAPGTTPSQSRAMFVELAPEQPTHSTRQRRTGMLNSNWVVACSCASGAQPSAVGALPARSDVLVRRRKRPVFFCQQ